MLRQLKLVLTAIQFLTRLPVPSFPDFQPDWVTRSARYFPLVGLIVGAASGMSFWGASRLWPPFVAAVIALGLGILLTGAFHEDGLADTFDGLFGGQDAPRRLAIMKDSRVGTYGAFAIAVSFLLKVTALGSLSPQAGSLALLAAHSVGRFGSVLAIRLTPYSGDPSAAKWKPVPDPPSLFDLAIAALFGLCPLLLLPSVLSGAGVLLGLGLAGLFGFVVLLAAVRLIGGHTGDVLGAVEQVIEIGLLLGLAARL